MFYGTQGSSVGLGESNVKDIIIVCIYYKSCAKFTDNAILFTIFSSFEIFPNLSKNLKISIFYHPKMGTRIQLRFKIFVFLNFFVMSSFILSCRESRRQYNLEESGMLK